MRRAARRMLFGGAALALLLVVATAIAGLDRAAAHGKEVEVRLDCMPLDPAFPLTQTCNVIAVFANDGEPVEGARLALSAVRIDRGEEVHAEVRPTGTPGHYSGVMRLPAYGPWRISVDVSAPAEGHVELLQQVLPPSAQPDLPGQARAQLLIRFNARDVTNIVALVLHLVGTMTLLAGTAVVVIGGLVVGPTDAPAFWQRMRHAFPPVSAGAFALIALSGLYNAAYNSPTRAPGLFTPWVLAGLPYGWAYLAAFAVKNLLAVALAVGTIRLALAIRRTPLVGSDHGTRPVHVDPRTHLGVVNLAIGGMLIIVVILLDYLHLLSHASVLLSS